ncbi:hypothetical protein ACFQ3K_08020 [Brucella gallinifaecis]|uniref:Uncharacterized protein n=1 Tax=Brucella gallinifaecis TaxID=215590 RepID=A0A502BP15_9HYPH|nr:hypothetical protein [Brucella gallinifaecis]TPF75391.1 hypothetical protein FHY56_08990 [Brucella gallinifaecis]
MQARTERRLGFVAAIALTASAFAMPAVSTHMVQVATAQTPALTTAPATLHASVDSMKLELSRLVAFTDIATKPVHYE